MMLTRDRTRAGRATAMVCAIMPPIETPTTWARSTPRWSSSPKQSSARSPKEYGARVGVPRKARTRAVRATLPLPRLERPVSRLSKRTTWYPRPARSSQKAGVHQFIGPPRPITSSIVSPAGSPNVW